MGKANKYLPVNESFSWKNNGLSLILLVIVAIFLAVTPFLRGLMITTHYDYSKNINIGLLIAAIAFLAYALTKYSRASLNAKPSYIQHLVWIIPYTSLLSQVNAASLHFAKLNTLALVIAAMMFLITFYLITNAKLEKPLFWLIYGSGIIVVVFGFMNWFNSASLFGLLQAYPDAIWDSGTGKRLTSVFQYPNTYATFLIGVGLISIFGAVTSKHWKQQAVFLAPLVPIFASILLTSSRWGWLSFPIILIVCLPFLSFKKQLHSLLLLVITGIITLAVMTPITDWGIQLQEIASSAQAAKSWLLLIVASVSVAGLYILLSTYVLNRKTTDTEVLGSFKQQFIIPISSILLGALAILALMNSKFIAQVLPAAIADRLSNISLNQHSVLERFTFYRDALEIFKDYPIFGAGGGSWASLFQMYQSNPYSSLQVHSHYYQLLAEKGLVGFIVTLLVYFAIFFLYIKSTIKSKSVSLYSLSWFTMATTILITSILDFHLSYTYIIVLLFISLGGMLAHSNPNTFEKINLKLNIKKPAINTLLSILYVFIAVVAIVVSILNINAYSKYEKALTTVNTIPYEDSLALINDASKIEQHPSILDLRVQLYSSGFEAFNDTELLKNAETALLALRDNEPYSVELLEREIDIAVLSNNSNRHISLLEEAIIRFHWNMSYYERLAIQYSQAIEVAISSNDTVTVNTIVQKINQLESTMQSKVNYLATLPPEQLQGRPFSITKPIAFAIGQAHYLQGEYELAAEYLNTAYDTELSYDTVIQAGLFYIATQAMLNQDVTQLQKEVTALAASIGLSFDIMLEQLMLFEPTP